MKDDPSIEKCDVFFGDIVGMKLEDSRTIRISFTVSSQALRLNSNVMLSPLEIKGLSS